MRRCNRMEQSRPSGVLLVTLSMIPILLTTGCFRASKVEASDADVANEIISSVFTQWKSGRTIDDLRNAKPPIYVADDFWFRGYQLKEFAVEKPAEVHGTNIRIGIKLWLVDLKGKEVTQSVHYLVTTTPAVTIAREDK
mgnify:CR=1 FL=1